MRVRIPSFAPRALACKSHKALVDLCVMTTRTCAREGCEKALPAGSAPQRRFCTHRCQWHQWRNEHPDGDSSGTGRKSLEDVLAGWDTLHKAGASRAEAAEALGISYSALGNALHRARAAGDPRAGQARPRRRTANA